MKKTAILAVLLLSTSPFCAYAQPVTQPAARPPLATAAEAPKADAVMEKVAQLQTEWARIKYKVDGDAQETAMEALADDGATLVQAYPDRAEPKIWQAIILSSVAGIEGGLSALPKVKEAKALLEDSLKIDPKALGGSASTSLGSLYYQVPSWPIGFGDDKKAEKYLKAALVISPDGIDPNFFYGDYLVEQKKYSEAVPVLEKALQAPDRKGREVADEGRRGEIRALLATAKKKAGVSADGKTKYN